MKGCRVSRSIYPTTSFVGTSIIYAVTDIVFSLKQHIPPSGELFCRSILSPLTGVMANRKMLYPFRLGARFIARPLSWSLGALVRQLSFYGPVSLCLGILFYLVFKEHERLNLSSHPLFGKKSAGGRKNIKKIFSACEGWLVFCC